MHGLLRFAGVVKSVMKSGEDLLLRVDIDEQIPANPEAQVFRPSCFWRADVPPDRLRRGGLRGNFRGYARNVSVSGVGLEQERPTGIVRGDRIALTMWVQDDQRISLRAKVVRVAGNGKGGELGFPRGHRAGGCRGAAGLCHQERGGLPPVGSKTPSRQEEPCGFCILQGSLRPRGNTEELAKPFVSALREGGAQVEVMRCRDKPLRPAWLLPLPERCGAVGCAQRDDMQEIVESILRADVLVFATPSTTWQATAPMKAVMDRMYGLE